MGIKKLYKLLEKHFPESIKIKKISEFKGKKIAVDAYLILYQFLIAISGKNKKYFIDANGKSNGHIHIILNKTIFYLKNGILPIYVWDGIPPDIKLDTLESRKKSKLKAKNIIDNLDKDDKNYIKYLKRTVSLKNSQVNDCINLLNIMGIPYVKAPGEADSQCAALALSGVVDAVVSEDMDILTFGSPLLIKKISSKTKEIVEIKLSKILEKLCDNCSYDKSLNKFIDLCILLKCDYCSNIVGIGPEKALKYIKKYGSIDNIKKNIDNKKINITDDYLKRCEVVKDYFRKTEIIDPEMLKIKWRIPNEYKLLRVLNKENNIKIEKINKFIDLMKGLNIN